MSVKKLAAEIKNNRPRPNENTDMVYGRVTSIRPLKIKVDSRFEIGANHLMLSQMVKELTVWDGYTNLVIFRALTVGDRVRMLRVQKGQMYYVLERI